MHSVQDIDLPAAAPAGLRASKKAQTRRRLTAAARTLTLEHGLDGMTVEQVCTAADVSVRTFFNYFDSKETAVLGEPIPLGTPAVREAFLAGGPSGDLLADVLALLDPSDVLPEGRETIALTLQLAEREPRLLARLLTRLSEQEDEIATLIAQRQGVPEDDPGCVALAAAAQALLRSALRRWICTTDDAPLHHHLDVTLTAFRATLAPAAASSAS